MVKKAIVILALAFQFVVVANHSLAFDPEPGCWPCPDSPPAAVR